MIQFNIFHHLVFFVAKTQSASYSCHRMVKVLVQKLKTAFFHPRRTKNMPAIRKFSAKNISCCIYWVYQQPVPPLKPEPDPSKKATHGLLFIDVITLSPRERTQGQNSVLFHLQFQTKGSVSMCIYCRTKSWLYIHPIHALAIIKCFNTLKWGPPPTLSQKNHFIINSKIYHTNPKFPKIQNFNQIKNFSTHCLTQIIQPPPLTLFLIFRKFCINSPLLRQSMALFFVCFLFKDFPSRSEYTLTSRGPSLQGPLS